MRIGVPITRLSRSLFEEHRFEYLKLLGEALDRAQLVREKRFVWTAVTQEMLKRHDVTMEEVEGLIRLRDAGLIVEEVPVHMRGRAGGESKLRGKKALVLVLTVGLTVFLGERWRRKRQR